MEVGSAEVGSSFIRKESKPPIWRQVQVPSATTQTQLHDILSYVLGWEGSYLSQFVIGGSAYGDMEMTSWRAQADAALAQM